VSNPPKCSQTGGQSDPDAHGDVHTHTCWEDKGHGGSHCCYVCPHTW
jgi:hypothetical protein